MKIFLVVVMFSLGAINFIISSDVSNFLFLQNVPFIKFHLLILVLARDAMKLCQK